MNYTKGETAGGWIHIHSGKMPIALVHPKHVDKFLAAPEMYEALKDIVADLTDIGDCRVTNHSFNLAAQALAKAEGK